MLVGYMRVSTDGDRQVLETCSATPCSPLMPAAESLCHRAPASMMASVRGASERPPRRPPAWERRCSSRRRLPGGLEVDRLGPIPRIC